MNCSLIFWKTSFYCRSSVCRTENIKL